MDQSRPVVLIPAYREVSTIGSVIEAAVQFAPVLVADDCSEDGTAEAALKAGASVIRNPTNLGYVGTLNALFAAAIKQGFTHAVTMDADGEHDPMQLEKFLELLVVQRYRLVLGVRPKNQRIAEAITSAYASIRFGISDPFCGMKGYELSLVQENSGFDNTHSIGTELAFKNARIGVSFAQVPVGGTPRIDAPRFGRRWRANMQLLAVLLRLIIDDFKSVVRK